MPKFSTESKYLKHTDLPEGEDTIVTIKSFRQEDMEKGEVKQKKWVIYFEEMEKGLALNSTNGKTLCKILGSEEMNDWKGRKIALYTKDDIEYAGELVSGIRVRPRLPKDATANA